MNLTADLRRDDGRWSDLLLMSGLWAAMVWIANPIGNFPLNDDWTYGVSVKALVEEGRMFYLTEWACKTLVGHVFWGALFCLPFGFSYTALRFSQLTAGLLGSIAAYYLCLELGASRRTALVCALTLLVNPLYFQLSNTFMTDVAFTAGCTLAILLLIKGMLYSRIVMSGLGWILVGISIWVRELTLMVPAGFALMQVYRFGITLKVLARAALPTVVFFVLLWIHQNWLVDAFGFPNLNNGRSNAALDTLIEKPFKFVMTTTSGIAALFMYLGLFALPMLIWFRPMRKQDVSALEYKLMNYTTGAFVVLAGAVMLLKQRIMPLGKNALIKLGLGPLTLRDTYLLHLPNLPQAPTWFWLLITVVSLFGAIFLVRFAVVIIMRMWELNASKRAETKQWIMFFLFGMLLLYSAAVITSGYFDRYLLIYLPILAAFYILLGSESESLSRFRYVGVVGVLSVFALFGSLATHDYISWNRLRWDIVEDLNKTKGVPPDKVDGGYEVNGTLMFDIGLTTDNTKSWWWVDDDEYVIAFGPMPGYEIVEKRAFPNYLYSDESAIHVLKRL